MSYEQDRAQVQNIVNKSALADDAKTRALELALALLAGGETAEEAASYAIKRANTRANVEKSQ